MSLLGIFAHLKTVFIAPIDDKSGSGELRLKETFKDRLTRKFLDDNTLQVAERSNADALVECTIISFSDAASNVSPGNRTDQAVVSGKRITIGAKVLFKDLVKKKTISEKNYSNYDEYQTTGNVQLSRSQAVDNAIEKLSDDILIGTVSNW